MNLLIVEDEPRLRSSLAHHIPWSDHGIEVVGLAANGNEALKYVGRKKTDILLLDIQIPGMDGLTLLKTILEKDKLLITVILSGHDNFAYAQTALELGVFKYLLKPAGDREILQAVLGAAEELRRIMEKRNNMAVLQQKWKENLPALQNNAFIQILQGCYGAAEREQLNRELSLNLSRENQYAVAVIDIDQAVDQEPGTNNVNSPPKRYKLMSVAKEWMDTESCRVCSDAFGMTILLFTASKNEGSGDFILGVHSTTSKLLSIIQQSLKVTASAGISSKAGELDSLHELYKEACRALQSRKIYGGGIAFPYQGVRSSPADNPAISFPYEKELEIALYTMDKSRALQVLESVWRDSQSMLNGLEAVHEQVMYFSSFLIRFIHKQGWRIQEVVGKHAVFFQNIHLLKTPDHIYNWLEDSIRSIVAYGHSQGKTVRHQTVKTILELVEREIDQDLTLDTVADRLYVNASYLSRLFKQETGKTFTQHVLGRKMEQARMCLMEGCQVQETAYQLGYKDVSYFIKVFRKYWGTTPGCIKA